jgi:hypothetical protein
VGRRAVSDVPFSTEALAESVAAAVRARGGIARRELPKVPPSARPVFEDALRAHGLEVTRGAVRVPADAQLASLFERSPIVEEKGLAAKLAHVTGPEVKARVLSLVRAGELARVERPTGPALARTSSEPMAGTERTANLVSELERAIKWLRRSTHARGARPRILERDLDAVLAHMIGGAPPAARSEAAPDLLTRVARAAARIAEEHGGLAPVAALVRALGAPTASVHAALLEGHARGWFALQPESSMGRLGPDDLALCPPGPQGTHLSWVRPLVAVPAETEVAQ